MTAAVMVIADSGGVVAASARAVTAMMAVAMAAVATDVVLWPGHQSLTRRRHVDVPTRTFGKTTTEAEEPSLNVRLYTGGSISSSIS